MYVCMHTTIQIDIDAYIYMYMYIHTYICLHVRCMYIMYVKLSMHIYAQALHFITLCWLKIVTQTIQNGDATAPNDMERSQAVQISLHTTTND